MARRPRPGDPAPDFTLPGIAPAGRADFTLSAERGRPVVLVFYPGDGTPVCSRQLSSYRDEQLLRGTGALLWGISAQSVDSHEQFAARLRLPFPLLSDRTGEVRRRYGVTGPLGLARAVFVVNPAGVITWARVAGLGLRYPKPAELAAAVRAS
jgi:peroxiredoxin Q/BCP